MSGISRRVMVGTVLALLASILAAVPSAAAPPEGRGGGNDNAPNVAWRSCYKSIASDYEEFAPELLPIEFECATVRVPLDYDGSDGGNINIAMVRLPARDQANRIGSLFTNPGGPSGSGTGFALFGAASAFSPEVRDRFDIIGFDPRGVLFSSPARCYGNQKQLDSSFSGLTAPRTDAEIATWLDADRELQDACAQRGRRILDHMSTANVARDMDLLREAVGDEQITFAGYSYGSMVGANYANLFPDNIRAMILDSALDPVAWTTGGSDGTSIPVTTRVGSHIGSQAALDEFFELCSEAGPDLCPIADDPEGRWSAVLAELDASPLQLPLFDENGPTDETIRYSGGEFLGETLSLLYAGDFWPIISFIVADLEFLLDGAPPEFATQFASDLERLQAGEPNSLSTRANVNLSRIPRYFNAESFPTVLCSDSVNPSSINAWYDAADDAEEDSVFGAFWTWSGSICNGWPGMDEDRYLGPWDAETSNTVLILNNSFDPATPIEGARAMEAALGNAKLIEVVGGRGHIAVQWSPCAFAVQDAYLLTAEIPPIDSCEPGIDNPFDLFGAPPGVPALIEPIDGEGEPIVVILVDGPTPELPVALDPESGEPLNIDPETGEVLPIVIIEILE